MDKETELKKFYDKLSLNSTKKTKKANKKSIILSIIGSSKRYRLFNDSKISASEFSKDVLNDLLSENLIRETDTKDYVITPKGIWDIENKINKINDEIFLGILLDYIDRKFFNVYEISKKPLSDRQKVMLFSMLAARTFSKNSCIDLNKDEDTINEWKNIISKSYEKLSSLNLISKLKKENLYTKSETEHPVAYIFRTGLRYFPNKTKGLFKALGHRTYFLDIYQNSKISKETLIYLFNLIFNDKDKKRELSDSERHEISDFCCYIANNKNIYVFDPKEHIFSKPEYDELIRDVLLFS